MDDAVKAALQRWPNVAAVRGWLRLDARGRWLIRQPDAEQHLPIESTRRLAQFAPITHPQMIEFINRHYVVQGDDCYFQNGPQRVYVRPERGPYVWRYRDASGPVLVAHTGQVAQIVHSCWLDAQGHPWLGSDLGPGHVLDYDLARWATELDYAAGDALQALEARAAKVFWRGLPVSYVV